MCRSLRLLVDAEDGLVLLLATVLDGTSKDSSEQVRVDLAVIASGSQVVEALLDL